MKEFFKVVDIAQVLSLRSRFRPVATESIFAADALDRVLAEDVTAVENLPDFNRSTMDGYAVKAASTYGASESNPAYLTVAGIVRMGEIPNISLRPGEAVKISTGGMLPEGADGVVMIEHTESLDGETIEVYKSVAPGQHVIERGEDFQAGQVVLEKGCRCRPQEIGLLGALGIERIVVYGKPKIAVVSTGDEVIPITETPGAGKVRDINSYSLSGQVQSAGGVPIRYGIVADNPDSLYAVCEKALSETDMVLISGGSSVGVRDFTTTAFSNFGDADILVHGIAISPGKPTILADIQGKPVWGMPGHVTSAMVVFAAVVKPFIERLAGLSSGSRRFTGIPAKLLRNISSAIGRTDFVRVRIVRQNGDIWAEPLPGKSGLLNTMVKADGMIEIGKNEEGLERGEEVAVIPF